jgi:hypothetical protein
MLHQPAFQSGQRLLRELMQQYRTPSATTSAAQPPQPPTLSRVLYTIDTITQIPLASYCPQTLVLLDIDGTLITPKHRILRPQNARAKQNFLTRVRDIGGTSAVNIVHRDSEQVLIEDQTADILKGLRCRSLAFTARRTGQAVPKAPSEEDLTVATLGRLGLKFGPWINQELLAGPYDPLALINNKSRDFARPGAAMVYQGVLFSNNLRKGMVLAAFLRHLAQCQELPTKIVMVDDLIENINDIAAALENFNAAHGTKIVYEAYWYRGVELLDNNPYPLMVEIQEMMLHQERRFIDDEMALELCCCCEVDTEEEEPIEEDINTVSVAELSPWSPRSLRSHWETVTAQMLESLDV